MKKKDVLKKLHELIDAAFEYTAKEYGDQDVVTAEDLERVIVDGVIQAADRWHMAVQEGKEY